MGGCFGAHGHGGNNEGIKLQVKRLRLYITQQMQKQIQECMKLEKMLIGQFQKEKSYRAMLAQDSIINQIVEGINRNHCKFSIMQALRL